MKDSKLLLNISFKFSSLFVAIRSGDYYLFEESEDELEADEGVDIIKFGMGEERDKDAPPTPMEVMSF